MNYEPVGNCQEGAIVSVVTKWSHRGTGGYFDIAVAADVAAAGTNAVDAAAAAEVGCCCVAVAGLEWQGGRNVAPPQKQTFMGEGAREKREEC